jgi:pimeloyl-ACP methyl ester carboxylesterase
VETHKIGKTIRLGRVTTLPLFRELLLKTLLIAALAAAVPPPVSQLNVEGYTATVHEMAGRNLGSCPYNRIMPDPTSRRLVIWGYSRDLGDDLALAVNHFVVADLPPDEADDQPLRRVAWVSAPFRTEPLRWSESGERLLLRAGENGAALFDPAEHRLEAAPNLDPLWSKVRFAAISHGDLAFYSRPEMLAQLRRIEAEGAPIRARATIGRATAAFLIFRYGNGHTLTAYDGEKSWPTGVPISFASAPLLPPGSGRPLFMGDQTGYRTFLPYAMPLVDFRIGRVVGRFGWERIERGDTPVIDLGRHFRQLVNVIDAAANGDTIFALVDLDREMRVTRVRGREIRSWKLCEKQAISFGPGIYLADNSLPAGTPVKRTEILFGPGRAGDPGAFGHLYRPLRADGRLIVHFHGGPTATLAEQTVPREVATFAPLGISVLEVEYSGALGGGLPLSERLSRLGLRAIREDVDAVTRWVRRSGFRRAYFIGNSFGGAAAAIAAVEHADAYGHIFLITPFLNIRNPEESVKRRFHPMTDATLPASQREFEEMVYGGAAGRRRLGVDLQAYVKRLRPSSRLSFYFGELDPISAVTDLPASFAGHPSVLIRPGMSHATDPAVDRDIDSKLGITQCRPTDFQCAPPTTRSE